MEITNYITTDFKAIDSQDTIATVKDFFEEIKVSHFPVVEEGVFIGNLSAEDVETFEDDKKVIDYKYTLETFFARTDTVWLEVLEVFAKNHSNLIPVLDENNAYVGYYEIEDILELFSSNHFFKRARTYYKS